MHRTFVVSASAENTLWLITHLDFVLFLAKNSRNFYQKAE